MGISLTSILAWIASYGYYVIIPAAVVEGPIVTVLAGFLASHGYFSFFGVYAAVVLADLIGDALYYIIGRFGGRRLVLRWGGRFGLTEERFGNLTNYFKNKGGRVILFGKLTHSAGWMTLTAAGVAGMPVWEFLWYNLLGTLPKSLGFLVLGYYAGAAFRTIDSYISKAGIIIFVILLMAGGIVLVRRHFRNKIPKAIG